MSCIRLCQCHACVDHVRRIREYEFDRGFDAAKEVAHKVFRKKQLSGSNVFRFDARDVFDTIKYLPRPEDKDK